VGTFLTPLVPFIDPLGVEDGERHIGSWFLPLGLVCGTVKRSSIRESGV